MITQNGLEDIFDDIAKVGQNIIDAGAQSIGIEKGGVIDKSVTTAADLGKKAGIVPGNTSGNGYIDEKTMDAAKKILGGSGGTGSSSGGTTSSGTTSSSGGSGTSSGPTIKTGQTRGGSTDSYQTSIDTAGGVVQKVNPAITGLAVGAIVYSITGKLTRSAVIGTGAMLAHQAYKFNRMGA